MSPQPVPLQDREARPALSAVRPHSDTIRYIAASAALLLPCFWQSRIQAGDLSSHVYNSWLAGLIEKGRLEGLTIAHPSTNVLFDLILAALFRWLGPAWAQRLAVSLAVLVFAWGVFAFVRAVSGRKAWPLLPCIAMLSYGWVFHMGFFNFYLAVGLCFWALAWLWNPRPLHVAAAVVAFALAYAAHALPVAWAVALLIYGGVARRLPENRRAWLMAPVLALLLAAHFAVRHFMVSAWSVDQLSTAIGADQLWVYDSKYFYLMGAFLLIWAVGLFELISAGGGRAIAGSVPAHWCALSAAGVFLIPSSILIPGFHHALVYISERMSLGVGICFCALLAGAPLSREFRYATTALALVFFVFLFHDGARLNAFEDRVDRAVAQLPEGQRVVSPFFDGLRAYPLTHMVDRACIGRCFSYANYEPSTAQFRIRAVKPNPYVIADYGDSFGLQDGKYVVRPADLPLWSLEITKTGAVTLRSLKAGVPSGAATWNVLEDRPAKP